VITKGIIDRIYEAASIQRWNDHVRPFELTELDKQAHKMVIAYVLAKFEEEESGRPVQWIHLIEGGFFEFLHRVILTDLKPPVFHRMMETKSRELNEWVLKQLGEDIAPVKDGFHQKFIDYFSDPGYAAREKRILRAAHYLATHWEFKIIYTMNPFIYGIERTKEELENQIEDHYDLIGVQKIMLGKKSFGFIDFCGQLRFQQRWAQTPRIPKTSVLGHMLVVAMLSYLCSLEIGACPKRLVNNYFAALFHDLPEVLTRDIVSPVKGSVAGLDQMIKEYETVLLEERIFPLLPSKLRAEVRYFIEDEFQNKIKIDNTVRKGLSIEEISASYNEDRFDPVDGQLLKVCDHLAAYIEATLSMEYGIKSHHLEEGRNSLYAKYKDQKIAGLDIGRLFSFFSTGATSK